MTINVDLMQKTLDYIAMHPEEHDQDDWAQRNGCDTTRCMAGTAVHVAPGWKLYWFDALASDDYDNTTSAVDDHGRIRSVSGLAEELLGLDYSQANDMFYQASDLEDLYAYAERFTGIDMRVRELVSA